METPPTSPPRPAGRQPEAVADATRRRILAEARRLFAARGFEALGLRDIAEAAGVRHGLIRHHFGGKLGLWQAVVDAADRDFAEALAPLVAADPATRAAARREAARFVTAAAEAFARNPDVMRLVVREAAEPGERLDAILAHLKGAKAQVGILFGRLRRHGLLADQELDDFFVLLLLTCGVPYALPALVVGLGGLPADAKVHGARMARLLLR